MSGAGIRGVERRPVVLVTLWAQQMMQHPAINLLKDGLVIATGPLFVSIIVARGGWGVSVRISVALRSIAIPIAAWGVTIAVRVFVGGRRITWRSSDFVCFILSGSRA